MTKCQSSNCILTSWVPQETSSKEFQYKCLLLQGSMSILLKLQSLQVLHAQGDQEECFHPWCLCVFSWSSAKSLSLRELDDKLKLFLLLKAGDQWCWSGQWQTLRRSTPLQAKAHLLFDMLHKNSRYAHSNPLSKFQSLISSSLVTLIGPKFCTF